MLSISQKLIQHDKQFKYLSDKIHELDNISQTIQNPIQNPIQNLPYIWTQKGIDIDGEASNDWSGYSVSLSANGLIVAIGAHRNDTINGSETGHVRVYEWNGVSMWTQKGIDIDGETAGDYSGYSVSLSADGLIVAIGAHQNNTNNGSETGHVRVYEWDGMSMWVQKGIDIDIDGEAIGDWSGHSVSLSADGLIVAIGAYRNDTINSNDSGYVRVYEWNGMSMYIQKGIDIDGEASGDWSGFSVSLSADGLIVAIGAYGNNGIDGINSGHVRVYEWNGVSMYIQKGIDIDGEASNDWSGYSVSLSADGLILAIGAYRNDGINGYDSGHVRVYEWNGVSTWIQKGIDIDGEAPDDYSGYSVSLSADGLIVAIGARRNSGINGAYSGHVRVYEWDGMSMYIQKGIDIDGEAQYDWSGFSVSLSADGLIVAIGAHQNDGINSSDSGHVRVHRFVYV
jgi:hypothetical protein